MKPISELFRICSKMFRFITQLSPEGWFGVSKIPKKSKSFAKISLVFVVILGLTFSSFIPTTIAAPNLQINYQGKLTDSSGNSVTDGDYQIEFNLYTASSGGTAVWTETHSGANEIAVTNGLFSVMLGSISSLASLDFNRTLYLGVTVEADAEMTPRKILGTVPSAFEAQKLNGASVTDLLSATATNATATITNFNFTNGIGDKATITSATSTSLFSTVARFTTSIIETLTATVATITNLTVTNSTTTNATTTSLGVLGSLRTMGASYLFGGVNAPYFTATSTSQASTFPYASSTSLTVSGSAYLGTSGENIGIGTTTPEHKLSIVQDGGGHSGTGLFTSTAFGPSLDLRGDSGTAAGRHFRLISSGAGDSVGAGNFFIYDSTASANRFLIDSDGNIGIGTTSPGQRLSVAGSILGDNIIGRYFTATSTTQASTFPYASTTAITSTGSSWLATLGGSVGIGTTSPSATLNIAGSSAGTSYIRVDNTNSNIGTVLGSTNGVTSGFVGTLTNHNFSIRTNNTDQVTIDTSGNVGIGTSTPQRLLSVDGVIGWGDTNNELGRLTYTAVGGNPAIAAGSSKGLTFYTDNANTRALDITSAGYVGIGTTSPYAKLSVVGQAVAEYFTATSTTQASTFPYASTTAITSSGSSYVGTSGGSGFFGILTGTGQFTLANVGKVEVVGDAASNARSIVASVQSGATGRSGSLVIKSSLNSTSGVFDAARITHYGASGAYGSANYYMGFDMSTAADTWSTKMAINGVGNVGIGTVAPDLQLDIESSSATYTGVELTNTDGSTRRWAVLSNSNSTTYGPAKGFAIRDISGGTSPFVITTGGSVGIGTTTPNYKLTVNTGGFSVEDSATNLGGLTVSSNARIVTVSGVPSGTTYTTAPFVINPASAGDTNRKLIGVGYGGNERFSVDVEGDGYLAGNFGISSTTPYYPLSIQKAPAVANTANIFVNGLSLGGAILELARDSSPSWEALIRFSTANLGASALQWKLGMDNDSTNNFHLMDSSDNKFLTVVDGGSTGSIGVNKTPSTALDVLGTASSTGLQVNGTATILNSPLTLGNNTEAATRILINGAAGAARRLQFSSAGVNRWVFGTSEHTESGGNSGSAFYLQAWGDVGNFIDNTLFIGRATTTTVATPRFQFQGGARFATPSGFTSPNYLDVRGPSGITSSIVASQDTGHFAGISSGAASFSPVLYWSSGEDLRIGGSVTDLQNITGLSEVARFTGAGNFGLGTTSPGSLFSLGNTGDSTINIYASATSTFGHGINLRSGCFAVNGTCISGGSGGSGTPGGSTDGNVQYKSGSSFAGTDNFHWDNANTRLGIGGTTTPYGVVSIKGSGAGNSNQGKIFVGADSNNKQVMALLNNGQFVLGSTTPHLPEGVDLPSLLSIRGGSQISTTTYYRCSGVTCNVGVYGTSNHGLMINQYTNTGDSNRQVVDIASLGMHYDNGGSTQVGSQIRLLTHGDSGNRAVVGIKIDQNQSVVVGGDATPASSSDKLHVLGNIVSTGNLQVSEMTSYNSGTQIQMYISGGVSNTLYLGSKSGTASTGVSGNNIYLGSGQSTSGQQGTGSAGNGGTVYIAEGALGDNQTGNSGSGGTVHISGGGAAGSGSAGANGTINLGSTGGTGGTVNIYADTLFKDSFSDVGSNTLCWDGTGGSNIGNCTSLAKYKTNVEDLEIGLDEVLALTPRTFNWINGMGPDGDLGFIAEEVELISPQLASYDGERLNGVKYDKMSALLVKAIQEQQAQIINITSLVGGNSSTSPLSISGNASSTAMWSVDDSGNILASRSVDFGEFDITNIKSIAGISGLWSIDEDGRLVVEHLEVRGSATFGSPERRIGITLYDEETGEPYCLSISDGETRTRPGACSGEEEDGNNNDSGGQSNGGDEENQSGDQNGDTSSTTPDDLNDDNNASTSPSGTQPSGQGGGGGDGNSSGDAGDNTGGSGDGDGSGSGNDGGNQGDQSGDGQSGSGGDGSSQSNSGSSDSGAESGSSDGSDSGSSSGDPSNEGSSSDGAGDSGSSDGQSQ